MCHKTAATDMENRRVVAHDRKVEKHLIDFRVAVAADGDDLLLLCVHERCEIGWFIADGQHVARTVVEVVATEDEIIGVFALEGVDGELEGVGGAMDVRDNEKTHFFNLLDILDFLEPYHFQNFQNLFDGGEDVGRFARTELEEDEAWHTVGASDVDLASDFIQREAFG